MTGNATAHILRVNCTKEFLSGDSYPLVRSRLRGGWVKSPAEGYQGAVFKLLQL